MNDFKIFEYQAIETVVPANASGFVYQFADQRQLSDQPGRTVIIEAIECYSATGLNGISPVSGGVIVGDDVLQNSFLTIKQGGNLTLQNIPLAKIVSLSNIGGNYGNNGIIQLPLLRSLRNITWSQCIINYRGISSNAPTSGKIYAFGVYYTVLEDAETMVYQNPY
jgi:predicted alpha/beta-fold hydrolase